jgi:hypothetical protein
MTPLLALMPRDHHLTVLGMFSPTGLGILGYHRCEKAQAQTPAGEGEK